MKKTLKVSLIKHPKGFEIIIKSRGKVISRGFYNSFELAVDRATKLVKKARTIEPILKITREE